MTFQCRQMPLANDSACAHNPDPQFVIIFLSHVR